MESLNKRILCMLLLGIFMISFTSALEFDNVKSYDPVTREVTITNSFGLGDEIGKARLNTPLNVKVGLGYQQVAEFDLWAYEDYNDAIKQFTFTDMKKKEKINRDFDMKILGYNDKIVEDYFMDCSNSYLENGAELGCERVVTGSHIEREKVWKKLTPADLKKNDMVTIGIFTDVKKGDYVDWIPIIYGVEIEEWATWTASTKVGVTSYYKLDELSGTLVNSVQEGTYDGTAIAGITYGATGILNNSVDITGNDGDGIWADSGITGDTTITGGAWFKTSDTGGTLMPMFTLNGDRNGNGGVLVAIKDSSVGKISILIEGVAWGSDSASTYNDGAWHHVILTQSGSSFNAYVDGGSSPVSTLSNGGGTWSNEFLIGARTITPTAAHSFNGNIDEVFTANRVFTTTEIAEVGTSPPPEFNDTSTDSPPTITFNSPTSQNYTSPQSFNFNFTASDDQNLSDVKLYINSILNQTNASGINNSVYLFPLTLGDGDYTIYGKATDNSSQETSTASIRIVINSTPFIEFLTPPTLINYANVSQSYVPMKVNVSTSVFENITYSLRNINGTNYTQFYTNQTYDINFTSVPDGHYHYDVTVCTTTNKCNSTETRHINHDVTPPTINLTSPSGTFDLLFEGYNLDLNWSVLDEADNLDSCWYTYNGTTVPINCSINTTSFNYSNFQNSLVFYSNDTFGNIGNATAAWGYLILEYDQDYDSQVTEGTPNTITKYLNVVGDTISSAKLSYNGTNYTTSLNYDSGNYTIASTVVAPLFDVDTNITFQLFMTISGTEYSTPTTTQLIQAINFSVCTTGDQLLNIFLFDEETKSDLSGTIEINAGLISKISNEAIESVLMEVNNTSNLSICLDPISSVGNFYLDADIVYSATDHAKEFYFMRDVNLSTIPINLSLFDLNLSSSTEFLVRYQGQSLIKVEGAIVQLQRYYISEDLYETVEAPLTGISGTAIVHIDLNTVKYKAVVVKDGEILDIFNDVVFDCENELSGQCTQNLYADVTPYNVIDGATLRDFSYAISDTGDKLVTTFSIPSGSTSSVNIVMTQRDQFGETTSCNRTVTTSSGSLECSYNQTIGDSYLFLEVNKDGESQAEKEYFVPEANGIDWGGLNWLFLFGLLISVALMAISSPEWIVGNAVVVLIIGGALWMADGLNIVAGLGLILWVIVAAIILILEMANKEDR